MSKMDQNLSKTIATAKELFPNIDSDVIEAIYKECGRNLEVTIDNLIEINNNNNNTQQQAHRSTSEAPPKASFKQNGKSWSESAFLILPDNFLRISDEDEFAIMLQNEEFLNELRFNQEFLKTLEQEGAKVDDRFEDRLKHMGKMGKKKFFQLAKMFSFQRNKNFKKHENKDKSAGKPLCNDE